MGRAEAISSMTGRQRNKVKAATNSEIGELEVVERVEMYVDCEISSLDTSESDDAWESVKYTAKYVIGRKRAGCKLPKNLLFSE